MGKAFSRRATILTGLGCLTAAYASSANARSISEASYIEIGGIRQWVEIRGADHRNRPLLVLHGGPGSTWDPFVEHFAPWEQKFTMVYWSQRGAGKTYRATGPAIAPTLTIERMVADAIEVVEHVKARLGHEKIVLLGHSWGSMLGVEVAKARPDLIGAFVGAGQVVSTLAGEQEGYRLVLQRARRVAHAEAIAELEAIGSPPYDDIQKMVVERRWADVFDTPSDAAFNASWKNPPRFTAADQKERGEAWLFSNLIMFGQKRQDGPFLRVDLRQTAIQFKVPMIFLHGDDDVITPISLVTDYVKAIEAPRKTLVLLRGGGHNAVFSMSDQFVAEMTKALAG